MKSKADMISLKAKMDKDEELQPLLNRMHHCGQLQQAIMCEDEGDDAEVKSTDDLKMKHQEMMKKADKEDEGDDSSGVEIKIKSVADLKKVANEILSGEKKSGSKKTK